MVESVEKSYKKLSKQRILFLSLFVVAIVFLFYNNYTIDRDAPTISGNTARNNSKLRNVTTIGRNTAGNSSKLGDVPTNTGNSTKLDPPGGGVIVTKIGGLGNQLFRYACSYGLAKNLQVPLYLEAPPPDVLDPRADIFYQTRSRPYILHKFALVQDKLESWNRSYPVFHAYDHDLFKFYQNNDTQIQQKFRANDTLIQIDDYCQAELFFKNYTKEIRSMFQLKMTPEGLNRPPFRVWIDAITAAGGGSVGIHVRRGDYLDLPHWSTPFSFYHVAIKMMLEKLNGSDNSAQRISFFVFSDDMDLIKGDLFSGINLPNNVIVHFVSFLMRTTMLEDAGVLFDDALSPYDNGKQYL